jgi:hypothetical protein
VWDWLLRRFRRDGEHVPRLLPPIGSPQADLCDPGICEACDYDRATGEISRNMYDSNHENRGIIEATFAETLGP